MTPETLDYLEKLSNEVVTDFWPGRPGDPEFTRRRFPDGLRLTDDDRGRDLTFYLVMREYAPQLVAEIRRLRAFSDWINSDEFGKGLARDFYDTLGAVVKRAKELGEVPK
ncbi:MULTISPECIES: hypothetical protein [Streptosporangium]|uniref:Uncharacterized protein n=1 Tax=Streptosporangium brasiliense TaxID=47480 RepID=A0ABT9RNL3_9ACTN|nr:hypothetical protein [Streptosporangium brasiliense]MDP9870426.1 hypothetical protein [Streptosporangium brasiliense]